MHSDGQHFVGNSEGVTKQNTRFTVYFRFAIVQKIKSFLNKDFLESCTRTCAVCLPTDQNARARKAVVRAADALDLTGRPPGQRAEEDRNLGNNEQQI